MHILVISNYYPPLEIGGWEQNTRDTVEELRQRGHRVKVLTSNHRAAEIVQPVQDVKRILHLDSPDHIHYQPHYILRRRQREQQNRRYLEQAIHELSPDIIYVTGMWNLPVSLAQAAENCLPHRVVYHIASYWPTESDAHHAYWASPANRIWLRPLKRWGGELARRLFLDSVPRSALAFEHVLCVSEFVQNYLVEHAGIPFANTQVVHNGVELAAFPLRDLRFTGDTVRLLYAGRLVEDKGVHTAIEAFAIVRQRRPDLPLTLSVVGSGAPGYEARLHELVDIHHLTDVVHFRRQVPREEMPQILSQHDILLLPSLWPEPLARITQEAMACGLVVIGTTTGGTPEILEDGKTGLTYPAGDAVALSRQIELAGSDRALRIRLALAGRHRVETKYDFERMVDEIEAYFLQVTGQASPTSIPFHSLEPNESRCYE